MRQFFHQFSHRLAIALIAIVLLQFTGGNMGEHQLHLGSHDEETENHPHLAYTAEVSKPAQCIDCSTLAKLEDDSELSRECDELSANSAAGEAATPHQHLVNITEIQSFDLCLDCQCHGGHVSAISMLTVVPSVPVSDAVTAINAYYLPPESLPDYRPPIV